MTTVDTVGVRNRGWILAKDLGMARYTAMDSVVRAVGKMVVWVDAAAEESTMISSRRKKTLPTVPLPNTAWPWMDSTSPTLLELPRPLPFVPMPANDCIEKITSAYVTRRIRVERMPAIPGVRLRSLVSSLTESAVSHPQ